MLLKNKLSFKAMSFVMSAMMIAIVIAVYIISSAFTYRKDLTRDQIYAVSPQLLEILDMVEDTVTVTFYYSSNLPPQLFQRRRFTEDFIRELAARSGGRVQIRVERIGNSEEEETQMRQRGIRRISVPIIEQDQRTVRNVFFHLHFQYGPMSRVAPAQDENLLEFNTAFALVKVLEEERPLVHFSENEQNFDFLTAISQFQREPMNMGEIIAVRPVNVAREGVLAIHPEARMAVLGKPVDYSLADLYEIDQYLMSGGHLVIFAEPVDIYDMMMVFDRDTLNWNIYDMLRHYGMDVQNRMVLDWSSNIQVAAPGDATGQTRVPNPLVPIIRRENINPNLPAFQFLREMIFPFASPVVVSNSVKNDSKFEYDYLMQTTAMSSTQPPPYDLNPAAIRQKRPPDSEMRSYPVAATVRGPFRSAFAGQPVPEREDPERTMGRYRVMMDGSERERRDVAHENARITIFGSGRLYSFGYLNSIRGSHSQQIENLITFFLNFMETSNTDIDLMALRSRSVQVPKFRENLTEVERNRARFLSTVGFPILLAAFGLVWMFKRQVSLRFYRQRYANLMKK